jgi:predicted dehydrogenase
MNKSLVLIIIACFAFSCKGPAEKKQTTMNPFTGAKGEVKLVTLDPGHFHAALIQKKMYDQIFPEVKVYAPEGNELKAHLALIDGYNTRAENPTSWKEIVYTGPDFYEKMIAEKGGNVLVLAGNNAKKTDYILGAVKNGLNVLSDKPMVITPDKFPLLIQAFEEAKNKSVLLYDVMTERFEVTTIMQKLLSRIPGVFGDLQPGTVEEPAITKESVHHFYKSVSGKPLIRPAWFYDVDQQGEGIVDVTTHLVDLVMWEAFPEQIIDYTKDIKMINAKRWTTEINPAQFEKSTGLKQFPDYLKKDISGNTLKVYSNGAFVYNIKGVHAKISVIWNYEAPQGTGDTHYSIMRGSRSNIIIKQGAEENFKPTLYVEALKGKNIDFELEKAIDEDIQRIYPGLKLEKIKEGYWKVNIPDKYKEGHEDHFGQVTERYLKYLVDGKLPDWEVPNMIAKYFTTTEALKKAKE